jgi:mRNA interferase MazF
VTYSRYDIVKVPFPFTDRQASKNRPALILSDGKTFNSRISQCVMAMITSVKHANWPLDTRIGHLPGTGLPAPSVIRLKLFTLDNRLILAKLGQLDPVDQDTVKQQLKILFCL